jgi:deoxyadenosine/deoxycytidine kinase
MEIDTSNLEATMDAQAISNGIKNRMIDQQSIEGIQRLMAEYESFIEQSKNPPRYGVSGTSVDAVPPTSNKEQIDRITEKYFLMKKYLESVM